MPYEIDTGYKTIFKSATPPVNWTKDTTYNDYTFRVVTGAASSGGTVDFSAAFVDTTLNVSNTFSGSLGSTAITVNQITSHAHYHQWVLASFPSTANTSAPTWAIGNSSSTQTSQPAGGGSGHTHPYGSGTASFTTEIDGTASSSVDLRVKYVDTIIAVRD